MGGRALRAPADLGAHVDARRGGRRPAGERGGELSRRRASDARSVSYGRTAARDVRSRARGYCSRAGARGGHRGGAARGGGVGGRDWRAGGCDAIGSAGSAAASVALGVDAELGELLLELLAVEPELLGGP